MSLKVVVNVSTISPPLAGIGRYSRYLVETLLTNDFISSIEGITPYQRFDRKGINQRIIASEGYSDTDLKSVVSAKKNFLSSLQSSSTAYNIRRIIENTAVKLRCHYTPEKIYWDPGFLLLPIELPSITTVYDLSHLAYPEYHPQARVKLLENHLEKSIERSDRIVTISEFSKDEIVKAFSTDSEKIFVVPPAVSQDFRKEPNALDLSSVRHQYQLPEQFILSICTLEPRKNLVSLINAFSLLPKAIRKIYPLVLVGSKGWDNEELDILLAKLSSNGEVFCVGYVMQKDLPLFYRMAKMLVYVSLYEGYGMPIAEAMASGTPVITSNCSSMPEVANGACVLVDPLDEKMISESMKMLLEDDELRGANIELGLENSKDYTWESSSVKLIQTMNSLC
jgi:alpha-1,3-rhamnosyl/mannosyltransferase